MELVLFKGDSTFYRNIILDQLLYFDARVASIYGGLSAIGVLNVVGSGFSLCRNHFEGPQMYESQARGGRVRGGSDVCGGKRPC